MNVVEKEKKTAHELGFESVARSLESVWILKLLE
jgi:hypothetical protein